MVYEDFELEIGRRDDGGYAVRVLHSPVGEARATMVFPFDELALESNLQKVEIEMLRSRSAGRRQPTKLEKAAEDFGSQLYEALFTGNVRLRWEMAREQAQQCDRNLRLKLRIEAPDLASIPWEFLYDRSRGEFLSLSGKSPLVRYLDLEHPRTTLPVDRPLRILGVICSPKDLPPLDVAAEQKLVQEALQDAIDDGLICLEWLPGQGWRDLQRAMATGHWNIVHFVGHGYYDENGDEGGIAMVDADGRARAINATRLGRILADHSSLRLVVLNSCEGARGGSRDIFSSAATVLVRRGIPAVLAMQYEISDRSAIEFASTFYSYLGEGLPVDGAVTQARIAMSLVADGPEWGTPVLYMHTTNGRIFDVSDTGSLEYEPQNFAAVPSGQSADAIGTRDANPVHPNGETGDAFGKTEAIDEDAHLGAHDEEGVANAEHDSGAERREPANPPGQKWWKTRLARVAMLGVIAVVALGAFIAFSSGRSDPLEDLNEPNDFAADAPQITDPTGGSIWPEDDADWFVYNHAGGTLTAFTEGCDLDNSDTVLTLLESDGTTEVQSNDDATEGYGCSSIEVPDLPAGDYYLVVESYQGVSIVPYYILDAVSS